MSDTTNNHDARGKFAPGNKAGKGNPHAKRVAELRGVLLEAVGSDDFGDVVRGLIAAAKQGDVQAAKVLLDRVLGPSVPLDVMERLEAVEARLKQASQA